MFVQNSDAQARAETSGGDYLTGAQVNGSFRVTIDDVNWGNMSGYGFEFSVGGAVFFKVFDAYNGDYSQRVVIVKEENDGAGPITSLNFSTPDTWSPIAAGAIPVDNDTTFIENGRLKAKSGGSGSSYTAGRGIGLDNDEISLKIVKLPEVEVTVTDTVESLDPDTMTYPYQYITNSEIYNVTTCPRIIIPSLEINNEAWEVSNNYTGFEGTSWNVQISNGTDSKNLTMYLDPNGVSISFAEEWPEGTKVTSMTVKGCHSYALQFNGNMEYPEGYGAYAIGWALDAVIENNQIRIKPIFQKKT